MRRHELTDERWEFLKPLLPDSKDRGRPRRDRRQVLNGIFWILRTGTPWRDLPDTYGPWQTVYQCFRKWRQEGIWDCILGALRLRLDRENKITWDLWCIDGSTMQATRAAAGGGEKGRPDEPSDHALGYSRGGFTTKVHLLTDGKGIPLTAVLTAGQRHESTQFLNVMNDVRIPQPKGRPRTRPNGLAGDKAYSVGWIREWLRQHNIRATIPQRSDQAARHKGRPLKFDREQYRRRNVVERCIGWLKECRRVATRFEKLAVNFLAMIKLAMAERMLRILF